MARAIATYPFQAVQQGDLSFEKGEVIIVLRKGENGWWMGTTSDGRQGIFPYNRVEIQNDPPPQTQAIYDRINSIKVSPEIGLPTNGQKFYVDLDLSNGKEISEEKTMKDFRVLNAAFSALQGTIGSEFPLGKLDKTTNKMVEIPRWADNIEHHPSCVGDKMRERSEILRGYLNEMIGDPKFDYLIVHWLGRSDFNLGTPEKRRAEEALKEGQYREENEPVRKEVVLVRALYDWAQHDQQEISFKKDEILVQVGQTDYEGWYMGQNVNGRTGLFPYNYVKALNPSEVHSTLNPVPKQVIRTNIIDPMANLGLEAFTLKRPIKAESPAQKVMQSSTSVASLQQNLQHLNFKPPGIHNMNGAAQAARVDQSNNQLYGHEQSQSFPIEAMVETPSSLLNFSPLDTKPTPLSEIQRYKVTQSTNFSAPQAEKKPRQRKKIAKYALCSSEAFDELLNKGVTVEENGKIATFAGIVDHPRHGDTVTLFYSGFIWEPQNQDLLEFCSSDDLVSYHSDIIPPGPLQFTIGHEQAIDGIEETVSRMGVKQSVRCILTPEKAYKEAGFPPDIPGNAYLVYDLTLNKIERLGKHASINNQGVKPTGIASKPADFGNWMGAQSMRQLSQRQVSRHNAGGMENPVLGGPRQASPNQFKKKLTLEVLQGIVKKKNFHEYGINPTIIEEYLTEQDFAKAFNVEYSTWLLMPVHRRNDLKKRAHLF